jgi:hypothetical protein
MLEEKGRCREIVEHPSAGNPSPDEYDFNRIQPVCMVPKGWMKEPRFKNSPFEGERVVDNPTKLLITSTLCDPLSSTYPYPEPRKDPPVAPVAEGEEVPPSQEAGQSHPSFRPGDPVDRRNGIRNVDMNAQYFKYKEKPTWGFGSSGVGFRFNPGTAFARQPAAKNQPHQRLRGFRELRDSIQPKSEEDYEKLLQSAREEHAKALAAGKEAAAKEAAPVEPVSPQPSPAATKRKSAGPTNHEQAQGAQETQGTDKKPEVPGGSETAPAPAESAVPAASAAADPVPEPVA